jgi:putative spermidine/putrescine transport system permease protein
MAKRAIPYLLILPSLILLGIFMYGAINGVLQGFGIAPYLGRTEFTLEYYLASLSDESLISSIRYSLYIATVSSLGAVIGGVALSAALTRLGAGRNMQLLGVQIPIMTAHMVVALGLLALFSSTGLIPRLLYTAGLIEDMQSFPTLLGATNGSGIILVYLWKEIPFVAFCTITLMSHIGDRYAEAAACLGANQLRTFFSITLPLCREAIMKAFLIVFAFAFGSYEIPFLLGPTLPKTLPVLAYIEFQSPDLLNHFYAMALNGITTGFTLILALIYYFIMRRNAIGKNLSGNKRNRPRENTRGHAIAPETSNGTEFIL